MGISVGKDDDDDKMRCRTLLLRMLCIVALSAYLWYVFDITVFGRDEYSCYRYKVYPFWSYIAILQGKTSLIREDILNVLMFVPIGVLQTFVWRKPSWLKLFAFGVFLSVGIELMQLVGRRGTCEFDDIFHNTLGCLIGYFVARLLMAIFKTRYLKTLDDIK